MSNSMSRETPMRIHRVQKENVPRIHPVDRIRYERELNLLRTRIGMVFQHFNLFPHMTALQNVTLGLTRVLKVPGRQARERAMA